MSPTPFGMVPPCQLAGVPVQLPALFSIHDPSAALVLIDQTEKQESSKTETGIFAETRSFRRSGLPVAWEGDWEGDWVVCLFMEWNGTKLEVFEGLLAKG